MSHRLALVIATRDRPALLRRLLESVAGQSCLPAQVIIVDARSTVGASWRASFPQLNLCEIKTSRRGLTRQKNLGVSALEPRISLVGFLDDDMVLERGAIEAMLRYWEGCPEEVGGAAFNVVTPAPERSRLVRWFWKTFLIHDGSSGLVLRSGYNTPITNAREIRFVEWLNGGSTVWRRAVVEAHRFEEWFERNGLCEDVHYSLQLSKRYKLAVVAQARVHHLEAPPTLLGDYLQGRAQILNRLYVVRNNPGLSELLCWWALAGQLLTNAVGGAVKLDTGRLMRGLGNVVGGIEAMVRTVVQHRGRSV